ncbi:MAG: endo-1,4-beta-xylanase [Bacteroidota bacterium]
MLRSSFVGCFAFILLACSCQIVRAQDAYHTALLDELQNAYGISGGTWVFSDTEAATLNSVYDSGNVIRQDITVEGQPFTRAMQLTTPARGNNPWDYFIAFPTTAALSEGDRALMVVWVRGLDAERGSGLVNANFERNSAPWTSSLFQGLIPSAEWQQWIIPFEASITHGVNQAQAIFHLGIMSQMVEFGGLAVINYGKKYTLDELPSTQQALDYTGRDLGASWRAAAAARIDAHRKRDLVVKVVDNRGNIVEGATVAVDMQQHHFGFGTAVAVWMMLQQDADGNMYRSKLENLNGNGQRYSTSVLENGLKWGFWENPGWPGNQVQTVGVIEELKGLGMTVRGHNLVWPSWEFLPDAVAQVQSDPAALRQLIQSRIADVAGHPGIKGELVDWDVLNEPAHLTDLADAFAGDGGFVTGEEVYVEWFKQAAEVDPAANLFINDYGLLTNSGFDLSLQERYLDIINFIEANGARIDGIGLQGHFSLPLTPPEVVYEVLDQYAATGKALSITEYDLQGVPEDLAAEYMRDLLTIAFSHPAMQSFLMWGFWDGAHWKDDAPLFRQDWSLKPSGQAFFDLVFDAWWTKASQVSDAEGVAGIRAFHGQHNVMVEFEGTVVNSTVTLEPGEGPLEVTIALPRQVSIGEFPAGEETFQLLPHYPEPASGRATLQYRLPVASDVRMEIYDVMGRRTDIVVNTTQPAGVHKMVVPTHTLANGVYLYRLKAGDWEGRRSLIVNN